MKDVVTDYLKRREDKIAPFSFLLLGTFVFSWIEAFNLQNNAITLAKLCAVYGTISLCFSYIACGAVGLLPSSIQKTALIILDAVWVSLGFIGAAIALAPFLIYKIDATVEDFNFRLLLPLAIGMRLSKNLSELIWAQSARKLETETNSAIGSSTLGS